MRPWWRKFGLLFLLGTSSVGPTLWGGFVFDDTEAILKNALVVHPETHGIAQVFLHDFWGKYVKEKS
jgi:hypothetical protein